MLNGETVSVNIRRIDLCDLILACSAAKELSNDGGGKWSKLRNELREQLKEFDAEHGFPWEEVQ